MINYTCPHCGKDLGIRAQYAGQKGKCNHCGGSITAPAKISSLPEVDGQVTERSGIRFSLLMGSGICITLVLGVGFMLARPTQAITRSAPVIKTQVPIPRTSALVGRADTGRRLEIASNHVYAIPPSSSIIAALNRIPIFVLAGQSNAEGNARLGGLIGIRDALPNHDGPLTSRERTQLRAAYRLGTGDWCNPAEDYSDEAADASIDALRASGLDLSAVSEDYTINGASMAAYRWRFQEASEPLGPPYQHAVGDPHTGHTTVNQPLGPGFGVWDDDDAEIFFYGPELGFGLRLAQSSALEEYSMVKVAMGGSSLSAHWAPNGTLRRELYKRTNDHLSTLPESYVAGLIWFQGFNDQFDESATEAYEDNLTQLIREFRTTYGEVPVVIVQARKVGGLSLIADAQHTVANTLDSVALVESDGLSECFHYDAASQLIIGQRGADAMVKLLNEMTEE